MRSSGGGPRPARISAPARRWRGREAACSTWAAAPAPSPRCCRRARATRGWSRTASAPRPLARRARRNGGGARGAASRRLRPRLRLPGAGARGRPARHGVRDGGCLAPGGLLVLAMPIWPSAHTAVPNNLVNLPPHHLTWWNEGACRALAARLGLEALRVGAAAGLPHAGGGALDGAPVRAARAGGGGAPIRPRGLAVARRPRPRLRRGAAAGPAARPAAGREAAGHPAGGAQGRHADETDPATKAFVPRGAKELQQRPGLRIQHRSQAALPSRKYAFFQRRRVDRAQELAYFLIVRCSNHVHDALSLIGGF